MTLHPHIIFKFNQRQFNNGKGRKKQLILLQIIIPAHIFDFHLMANETICICKAHIHIGKSPHVAHLSICLLYIYSTQHSIEWK